MITGRVWKFGEDINTDLILPVPAFFLPLKEQLRLVFSANRPEWVDQVQKGDIIVAGRNFGTGSGRPAADTLKQLGISCLLAESINGLFFRNCVNFAFPALECPGVHAAFDEGDRAEVDFEKGIIRNLRTGLTLTSQPWLPSMLQIVKAGGLMEMLETEGYIRSEAKK